eukprot:2199791-Amphidinium_carterae.1
MAGLLPETSIVRLTAGGELSLVLFACDWGAMAARCSLSDRAEVIVSTTLESLHWLHCPDIATVTVLPTVWLSPVESVRKGFPCKPVKVQAGAEQSLLSFLDSIGFADLGLETLKTLHRHLAAAEPDWRNKCGLKE